MTLSDQPFAVRIVVPARSDFLHLVRLNVAGTLGDAGFSIEEIDDVKIAVEELSASLLRVGDGDELDISISVAGTEAIVRGTRANGAGESAPLDEFVETILGAVVDSYELVTTESSAIFEFRKRIREQ